LQEDPAEVLMTLRQFFSNDLCPLSAMIIDSSGRCETDKHPPPPEIEVLKRASLVMALAALETYVEDRIVEAADAVSGRGSEANHLVKFYKASLETT